MTTLNVNEGASSSAGSHNELSSLLPTNSELAIINPITETQQQNQTSLTIKNEVVLERNNDAVLGRADSRSRMRHRHVRYIECKIILIQYIF